MLSVLQLQLRTVIAKYYNFYQVESIAKIVKATIVFIPDWVVVKVLRLII